MPQTLLKIYDFGASKNGVFACFAFEGPKKIKNFFDDFDRFLKLKKRSIRIFDSCSKPFGFESFLNREI
ncbi:hypothetical protein A9507_09145 [Methanobacterium sp. A39]|uniref:Uncharacterized protein n=1 Tax=Methanobacterium bryantii TaxID=2161 RepID=A0A2A2H9X5_METBR|nr:hypothetical protein A9507_09145 [Methanobacterium sp. A39]PAV06116.1 hypothetical protein ASJ80_14890 [Methanobacterium bryantii]